jgi:6-phosphogluconolactonase
MRGRQKLAVALFFGLVVQQAGAQGHSISSVRGGGTELVYIGTWGNHVGAPLRQVQNGPQGIYVARLDKRTGQLSAPEFALELDRADFLLTNPKLPVIYSVAATTGDAQANSQVYSLSVDATSGMLRVINKVDSGGADATALAFDAPSNTLFSAAHDSGDVTALPVRPDGGLESVVADQKEVGSGPDRRQHSAAPHGLVVDLTHRYLLVADFGADRVFVYKFNGAARTLIPAQIPFEALPAGSGPRHLVFHPNGRFFFLNTELTAELRSYRWDSKQGRMHLVQSIAGFPATSSSDKSGGDIALSRDGRFVYLSLRGGQDSLVVYAVNSQTGAFREIQRLSAQGSSPWSIGIDPTGQWLLVTNQGSGSVVVFQVNQSTGKLTATGQSQLVPKASAVTFYPN